MFRPLPILTVATIISLVILLWLGSWQYGRYAEKMSRDTAPEWPSETIVFDLIDQPGAPVQQVYGIVDGEAIWRRFAPATRRDTGELVLLTVDATGGVNPTPATLSEFDGQQAEVRIFERPGRSSARNRPDDQVWFVFDTPGLLAQYGLEGSGVPVAEPVELVIRNSLDLSRSRTTLNPYGAPEPIDPLPPQRHLGYAMTWWGLAAALFVIYWVFHASRGRLKSRT
ncbi:MAG: SURF1 family cytochrome oxidase biogenesis protein [Pseudomonadota bacterium]